MNRTLQDIRWLMARLYLAMNNSGSDASYMPEYMTLRERYGITIDDIEEAEKVDAEGIG